PGARPTDHLSRPHHKRALMSSVAAFDTISQRLTANWTSTPLVFENDHYDLPNAAAAFVYVEIWAIPGGFDQASIGAGARDDNLWRDRLGFRSPSAP
ncbi:hypothetical protein, partial [Mesorhizobium sp. M3A.F.Ca.ET.174.01.1.1]|uniref:hypothetical protein n=1 Tax=Mesorhizobium sp. M3A.F.Ca.ET.174.01.1.1 TaxID=2563944 RepID=UPI001AED7E00